MVNASREREQWDERAAAAGAADAAAAGDAAAQQDLEAHTKARRAAMLYDLREAGGNGAEIFRLDFVQNSLQSLRGDGVPDKFRASCIDAMVCQIRFMEQQLTEARAPVRQPSPHEERFRTIHWCVDQYVEHLLIVFEPKLRDSWMAWTAHLQEARNFMALNYDQNELTPLELRAARLYGLVSYRDWYLYTPAEDMPGPAGRAPTWSDTYEGRRG